MWYFGGCPETFTLRKGLSLVFQDAEEPEFAFPAVVEEQDELLVILSVTDPEQKVKQLQAWKGGLSIQEI